MPRWICSAQLGSICFCLSTRVTSWEDVIVRKGCEQGNLRTAQCISQEVRGEKWFTHPVEETKWKYQEFTFQLQLSLRVSAKNVTHLYCIWISLQECIKISYFTKGLRISLEKLRFKKQTSPKHLSIQTLSLLLQPNTRALQGTEGNCN